MTGADQMAAATLLIYDTALDPAHTPAMLESLAGLFKCHFADSFHRAVDYSSFGGVQFGLDPQDYTEQFLGVWTTRNVWGERRPVRMAGDILTTREMTPVPDLMRSEMYNDYLAPRDLHEGLRLDIRADSGWIEDVSLLRSWSVGPYTAKERRMAVALLPHLQRSALVSRRLRRDESLVSAGLSALESLDACILLLDQEGRITYRNPAAAKLLIEADGLTAGPEGLLGANAEATNKVQGLVAAAAGNRCAPRSGAIRMPCPSGRPALALLVMPLRREQETFGADLAGVPVVLVCISDPRSGPDARLGNLTSVLKLTKAEASLAADLLAGQDIRDIAERRGRSINTIRSQLAGLMAKTDTRRQAELVSFLARADVGDSPG